MDQTRHRRRIAFLLTTMLCSGLAAPAFGQAAAPEAYRNVDEHGVDLVTGTFNLELVEGDIGRGDGRIALIRYNGQSGYRDNWSGDLRKTSAGVTITFGKISETFTLVNSAWVAAKGNGATLVENISTGAFTYRASDGTTIDYAKPGSLSTNSNDRLDMPAAYCSLNTATACGIPTTITRPSGQRFDLTWYVPQNSAVFAGASNEVCTISYRLTDVRSSSGYAMKFKYVTNGVNGNVSGWHTRSGAKFLDLSQVYCSPTALNCDAVAGNWPTVSYATPAAGVTDVTRETGATYKLTTDGVGKVMGVRRPGASADTTIVTRNTAGRVTYITDDGETETYTYTDTPTSTTVVSTSGTNEVDTVMSTPVTGQPVQVMDGPMTPTPPTPTVNMYDANGRKTRETRPEGDYTNWTYDARGNITLTRNVAKPNTGLADIVTTADYDAICTNPVKCNKPNYTVDANLNRTDYTYDPVHGEVTRIQFPAPVTGGVRPEANLVYTSVTPQIMNASGAMVNGSAAVTVLSQVTKCATAATCAGTGNESKTTIGYTTNNILPISVTVSDGAGSISSTTTYTYDARDNLKTVDGPLPGSGDTITYIYDVANRRRGTINADPDGAGPRPRTASRLRYDSGERIDRIEAGTVNGTSDADLDAMVAVQTVDIIFDSKGNAIRQTLSSGGTRYAVSQSSYDADNRLTCSAVRMNPAVYDTLPTDACVASTLNAANGPDRITKNTYDNNGRIQKVQTALGTAEESDEVTTSYTANGLVNAIIDGEANRTSYIYDGHDRLSQTRYPLPAQGSSASSTTDFEGLTYDANSNVTGVRLRDGQMITLTYDKLDRLIAKDVPNLVYFERDITYAYDNLGRIKLVGNGVIDTSFTYDALGRTIAETTNGLNKQMEYDAASRMTKLTYPDTFFVNYDYDVTGNVTAIRENGATTGIGLLATYTYDTLGRRLSLTRGNGTVTSYNFDAVSRLSSLTQDMAATGQDITLGFGYNPASQIASHSRSNDVYSWNGHYNLNRTYTVNGLNQLTAAGTVSLGYDGRGNLTASGTTAYGYTSENRMATQAKPNNPGVSMAYDAGGRLWQVTKALTVTRFDMLGSAMLSEMTETNALLRRYVYGPGEDEPLVWYEGTGTADRRFLHADERGSIIAISNASGAVSAVNTYDEYGIPAATNMGRFGFTGQAWLPEVGLNYYKARIYSPTLGRFMQSDPIGYGDGVNFYDYVGGDPVNNVDPSGLRTFSDGRFEYRLACAGKEGAETCGWHIVGFSLESRFNPFLNVLENGGGRDGGDEVEPEKSGCGDGPRLVIGRYVGGTVFAGVGHKALGGSVSAGGGLSIPLNFFRTGSLAGTQVYASATLTGLVKGIGAFIGSTTGVSGGISNGPVSSFIPNSSDSGSYVIQGGAADGAGAEIQSAGPISNLVASVTVGLARGLGAYVAGGRQVNVTVASQQFGCAQ